MKNRALRDPPSGGVTAIKKEVSLSRSHSDSYRQNRPAPGDDVLRPTVSTNELGLVKVCSVMYPLNECC